MARYSWGNYGFTIVVFCVADFKDSYKDQKDNPTPPLWVPKVYGIGLSINPYHRFGKLIFILLAVLIVGIIISLLFTPASQINH